jgi:predicted nucleic acid-binding protein
MKYLLDVNALVALGLIHHEFHDRVASWIKTQRFPSLATCSIPELGFVRMLSQVPAYGLTEPQARSSLLRLKDARASLFSFISDDHDISHLPAWVKTPNQSADGHLVELAAANGAILTTLDERIPGSYRIR